MSEPLSITLEDRADLYAARGVVAELEDELDDWRTEDLGAKGGFSELPVEVDRMHALARELVRHFQAIRRRHKKRLEARERRGSPLEG